MKKIFALLVWLLVASAVADAQTILYAVGSAVPGGSQKLTRFPSATSGKYSFKYHGKLLPGKLYITPSSKLTSASTLYGPRLEDSNIVSDGIAYKTTKDTTIGAWNVLFEADNYRFTLDTSSSTVSGELFNYWYEAWVVGGCVEDNQGSGDEAGHWQVTSGKAMERSLENPYEWSWTGELKNYTANDEPKRFKINGQYGWSPKVLHPYVQDQSILLASQLWYNGSQDYKWRIINDGWYTITVNVFEETIKGTYLGTDEPTGIRRTPELQAEMDVSGLQLTLVTGQLVMAELYTVDGKRVDSRSGSTVTLTAPRHGVYILHAGNGEETLVRKVSL